VGRIEIEPCVELGRGGPRWERNGIGGKYGMEGVGARARRRYSNDSHREDNSPFGSLSYLGE
jgi:hypothetical protein